MRKVYKKKYYYIYQIWNMINMHVYVGKHGTNNLEDGYFGSGGSWKHNVGLKPEIRKYGKDNFVMEIIYFCDDEYHMNLMERFEIAYTRKIYGNWFKDKINGLCINILDGGENEFRGSTYETARLAYKTKLESGYYESDKWKASREKARQTLISIYGSTTAHMNTEEARRKKGINRSQYLKDHPEAMKALSDLGNTPEARAKAIETKREHGFLENMAMHSKEAQAKSGRTLSDHIKSDEVLRQKWSDRASKVNADRHNNGYYESDTHKRVISRLLSPEAQKKCHAKYAYIKPDGYVVFMDRGNAGKHKDYIKICSKDKYMKKVYISAGWFSPAQEECRLDLIDVVKKNGLGMFSPKDEVEVKPDATSEDRKAAFKADVDAITDCDFMVASTEGKDIGVSIEIGIAYERNKPVILYFPHPELKVNLMLAELAVAVCYTKEELDKAIKYFAQNNWDFSKKLPYTGNIE